MHIYLGGTLVDLAPGTNILEITLDGLLTEDRTLDQEKPREDA